MQIFPPCNFPTDNYWGVPCLLPGFPVAVPAPVLPWGCQARTRFMNGAWHFYTDDSKFEALWKSPQDLLKSSPVGFCEVNFTIPEDVPAAIALYQVYRKRFLSRAWQSKGLNCFVDLSVHQCFEEINLLGIPDGWGAFCTRGSWDIELLRRQLAIAREFNKNSLFLVYAGGKKIEAFCLDNGLYYFPSYRGPASYKGIVSNGGQ